MHCNIIQTANTQLFEVVVEMCLLRTITVCMHHELLLLASPSDPGLFIKLASRLREILANLLCRA